MEQTDITVRVHNTGGAELELCLMDFDHVAAIKAGVREWWGVVPKEQVLLLDFEPLNDDEELGHLHTDGAMDLTLVRGPPIHFDKALAHPHAICTSDGDVLSHGGQNEYQAAFLSDILDPAETYRVCFELEDTRNGFREMYVGVAPDANRNWSNLKGAWLNHLGVLVDDFSEVGWLKWRSSAIRNKIFTSTRCEIVPEADKPTRCEFVLEADMPNMTLHFRTADGTLVETLNLPELSSKPIRLCATLGYPGQKVTIK